MISRIETQTDDISIMLSGIGELELAGIAAYKAKARFKRTKEVEFLLISWSEKLLASFGELRHESYSIKLSQKRVSKPQ